MRPKIQVALITFAVFVAYIAAPSARAATTDDACSLLTQAQVSAAVGISMGAGSYVTPSYLKTCTWKAPDDSGKGVSSLTLSFQAANAYEAGKQLMEQSKAMTKPEKNGDAHQIATESASGIGEDAYYTSMGGNYAALMVKKGNVVLKIAIYGNLPTEKKKAVEKTLALQALSKV